MIRKVDLPEFTIQIEQGLTRDSKGAPILGRKGSRKARPRLLAITPWLAALIQQHIESLEDQGLDAWLFPDSTGGPVRYSNCRRREWLPALAKAGLGDLMPLPGPHDLRRLNVTQLAASGVDLRTLRTEWVTSRQGLPLRSTARPIPWRIELRLTPLGRTFSVRCRTWSARLWATRMRCSRETILDQVFCNPGL
jgi:hypothetical protein